MAKVTTSATDEGATRLYRVECPHGVLTHRVPAGRFTMPDDVVFVWLAKRHREEMPCRCGIGLWGKHGQRLRRTAKTPYTDDDGADDA